MNKPRITSSTVLATLAAVSLAACTDPTYDTSTYQGITPCLTVTCLSRGQSVTVSDGSATLTESSNGTFNFPGLANGSEAGAAVNPTATFSITATTGGATCSLAGGGATAGQMPSATAYAPSALCSKYPAVNPEIPKVTTMPRGERHGAGDRLADHRARLYLDGQHGHWQ
jgi:hypothetical protein